jgi:hypothetical protein
MARKKKVEPIILEGLTEETTDQKLESSGLGDMIASITSAVGIEPCGACNRRKEALNRLFPWLKASREVTEEELDFIKKITSTNTLQSDDVNRLFSLYNDIFSSKLQRCNCSGLISKMIQRLGVLVVE